MVILCSLFSRNFFLNMVSFKTLNNQLAFPILPFYYIFQVWLFLKLDCFSQCGVAVPWSGYRRLDICWSAQPRASWLGTTYAFLDTFGISGRSDPPSNSTYREGFKKRRKFSSFCLPPPMERCRYFSNKKSVSENFFFQWTKMGQSLDPSNCSVWGH